jgi:hypothetical protein
MAGWSLMRVPTTGIALVLCAASLSAQVPVNVRVSAPGNISANEVTIAVNPAAPRHLAAGSNLRFTYRSTDAGVTWVQGELPPGTYGDPSVTFDAAGNLYYAHLANLPSGYWLDRIIVHRSIDGGATWRDSATTAVRAPKQQDKEWIAADRTGSPYAGRLYMAWTEFDAYGSNSVGDSSRILFSRSENGGASWSAPLRVSEQAGNCADGDSTVEGAVPAVGPNGEVYLSWAGPAGITFARSTDGGVTWEKNIFVTTEPGGWDFGVSGIFRANGFPVTACDVSASPYRGRVYVNWTDQRNGILNTDVFLIASTDGGTTWGPVTRVNGDISGRDQFFSWMTVDPVNGDVDVIYYDRRNTVSDLTDVYVSRSTDGGATFSDMKVSQSSFFPTSGTFFGDYTGIDARGGKVYPIWMRLDTTRMSVWTAPLDFTTGVAQDAAQLPLGFGLEQNYPNPFNPATTVEFTLPVAGYITLTVYDVLGREVALLDRGERGAGRHTVAWEARGMASGIYVARLRAEGRLAEVKMVLLR